MAQPFLASRIMKDSSVRRFSRATGRPDAVESRHRATSWKTGAWPCLGILAILLAPASLWAQFPAHPAGSFSTVGLQPDDEGRGETQEEDDPSLPSDFQPPAEPPESLSIEDPQLSEEEAKQLENDLRKNNFMKTLRSGDLTNAAREVLSQGARFYVYRLSMPKHRKELYDLRERLMQHIRQAGRLENRTQDRLRFREFFLQEVADRCAELLDGNLHVRLNAVMVLGQLNRIDPSPNPRNDQEAVPFVPAAEPLLTALQAEGQPEAVRVAAVLGLRRILAYLQGARQINLKHRIANALIEELNNTESHYWHQFRVVNALGTTDLLMDRDSREPFIIKAVAAVLVDEGRHWIVRAEAAKCLGRLETNGEINVGLLAYETVRMARQMAEAYNKNPGRTYWPDCFWKTYLAFHPLNDAERSEQAGFRAKAATGEDQQLTQSAYQHVVSMAQPVVSAGQRGRISPDTLKSVDGWLEENAPDDRRIAPGLQPLSSYRESGEQARPSG